MDWNIKIKRKNVAIVILLGDCIMDLVEYV